MGTEKKDIYRDILRQYWGYDDFRGIQREIIESIGSGRDTLGLMPTGGGKSITFQVPALASDGTCIVVTPLIALMKDQVQHLRAKGVRAVAIYSGMKRGEIVSTLENCVLGDVKLLYVSPERLSSEIFQVKLRHMRVSFITVDEAHCISQWGYDFRPAYLEIDKLRKMKPDVPVLALTATATPQVIDDIQDKLAFKSKNVFRMSFERKNLSYVVRKAENKPAFIGYLPYGFPNPDVSLDAFKTMVEHGVDAVEIGLPYSDPVMDGPVIQAAASIALNNGETIKRVFEAVETVANAGGVPLIMSYWNLVYHYGVERFARDFENAGGAGLITPDLIPDEAGEWIEASDRHGLDRIFLVSPDSSTERLETVARNARGFVYAAARMGVTGERATIDASPELLVERTRQAGAENVCVGIGVSTAEQGAKVGSYADGVIVGSALVHTLLADDNKTARDPKEGLKLLAAKSEELAEGIHNAR